MSINMNGDLTRKISNEVDSLGLHYLAKSVVGNDILLLYALGAHKKDHGQREIDILNEFISEYHAILETFDHKSQERNFKLEKLATDYGFNLNELPEETKKILNEKGVSLVVLGSLS